MMMDNKYKNNDKPKAGLAPVLCDRKNRWLSTNLHNFTFEIHN